MEEAKAEKHLCASGHTMVVRVEAEVCSCCGEELYSVESVKQFELIRAELQQVPERPI